MVKLSVKMMRIMVLVAMVGLVFGCSSAAKKTTGAHARAEKGDISTPNEGGPGLPPQPTPGDKIPLDKLPGIEKYNVCPRIHFDYDKSDIKKEWETCLNNIASYFKDHPEFNLVIEGHCDERGTPEYNLALGERRANTTATYVTKRGIEAGRINTRSWGEEQPIATGHEESSWWQNRRAEFFGVKK